MDQPRYSSISWLGLSRGPYFCLESGQYCRRRASTAGHPAGLNTTHRLDTEHDLVRELPAIGRLMIRFRSDRDRPARWNAPAAVIVLNLLRIYCRASLRDIVTDGLTLFCARPYGCARPPEADLCWRELAIVAKALVDGQDVTEIGLMRDIALRTIAVLRDGGRM